MGTWTKASIITLLLKSRFSLTAWKCSCQAFSSPMSTGSGWLYSCSPSSMPSSTQSSTLPWAGTSGDWQSKRWSTVTNVSQQQVIHQVLKSDIQLISLKVKLGRKWNETFIKEECKLPIFNLRWRKEQYTGNIEYKRTQQKVGFKFIKRLLTLLFIFRSDNWSQW